ncbi:uncharacterized protein si:ch211-130h14.4 [Tachysurus vachellii]|uniref:uncharacterized protein si:ch211-130h14.4 n=1 Tax=Tachysurus vachellii TaxID=175792 RepID=UPI00296B089D|nr:uncharacterized protein si:ch211-130h14.4 [Tachysurus vachellii]
MTLKTQDIHHTSSFPSILDSYLFSEDLGKAVSVAKVVTQVKKLKERRVQRPVSAAELQKRKVLLEQRHLEAYRRLHSLKDRLSQKYAKLLSEKVQRQRQEMKQHTSVHLNTTEKHNGQSSRALSFQELVGSSLKDNAAFLKSLPKTHYYLILELQRQLGQRECLQRIREQEVFRSWMDHSNTKQLEKQLQQIKFSNKSDPGLKLDDLLKKKLNVLPKIQISLAENADQQKHHDTFSESGGGVQVSSPVFHGKQIQEQDESELTFPSVFLQKLQVPRFSTLQPSFLEAFRTNIAPLKANEPLHQSKTASVTQRKLHLMHSLSLFNMAQAQSLLNKNGLMMQYDKANSIQDMMEYVYPNIAKELRCRSDPPLPDQSLRDHTTPESSECIKEEINTQADQIASSELSEEVQDSCNSTRTDKVPLSMEDIYSPCILLGKPFNKKMWSNYA